MVWSFLEISCLLHSWGREPIFEVLRSGVPRQSDDKDVPERVPDSLTCRVIYTQLDYFRIKLVRNTSSFERCLGLLSEQGLPLPPGSPLLTKYRVRLHTVRLQDMSFYPTLERLLYRNCKIFYSTLCHRLRKGYSFRRPLWLEPLRFWSLIDSDLFTLDKIFRDKNWTEPRSKNWPVESTFVDDGRKRKIRITRRTRSFLQQSVTDPGTQSPVDSRRVKRYRLFGGLAQWGSCKVDCHKLKPHPRTLEIFKKKVVNKFLDYVYFLEFLGVYIGSSGEPGERTSFWPKNTSR